MRTCVRMHPVEIRLAAEQLSAAGLGDTEVARRLGLKRTPVRVWRVRPREPEPLCPRCWERTKPIVVEPQSYAELLGLYLGDGCVSRHARTYQLRLALDAAYPDIVRDACTLLRTVFPANRVGVLYVAGESTAVPW